MPIVKKTGAGVCFVHASFARHARSITPVYYETIEMCCHRGYLKDAQNSILLKQSVYLYSQTAKDNLIKQKGYSNKAPDFFTVKVALGAGFTAAGPGAFIKYKHRSSYGFAGTRDK